MTTYKAKNHIDLLLDNKRKISNKIRDDNRCFYCDYPLKKSQFGDIICCLIIKSHKKICIDCALSNHSPKYYRINKLELRLYKKLLERK